MARVSVRLSERSYEIEISGGVLAQVYELTRQPTRE